MPDVIPVINPVLAAVATRVLLLLQDPPPTASVSEVVEPVHTVAVPVMAPAPTPVLTVTINVAVLLPQLFETV